MEQEAAKLNISSVQQQLQEGNRDLAAANLSRESELRELRNQIAIVRCAAHPVASHEAGLGLFNRSIQCFGSGKLVYQVSNISVG